MGHYEILTRRITARIPRGWDFSLKTGRCPAARARDSRSAALCSSSRAAGVPCWAVSRCPSRCVPALASVLAPAGAVTAGGRSLPAVSAVAQGSAQRGDPSDMQSDAGRRSEAGEVCHSGAWREDHRAVRRSQEAWAEELFLSFWTRPWRASTRAGEAKEQLFPHRDGSAGERSEQRAVRRRSRSNLKSPEPPPQLKRAASHTTGLRRPSLYAEAVPACIGSGGCVT